MLAELPIPAILGIITVGHEDFQEYICVELLQPSVTLQARHLQNWKPPIQMGQPCRSQYLYKALISS
ncbi:hypothetical protein WJX75_000652 [Coccomyxa subellipsoidea]|uniref:Uncharacterized protein n=1 Tax=Coccomyxa subellipsoidea TaxID=248742 RepID=A0ABR2Z2Z4_9CHLO